ncbi:MAG: methionyl-tRNA formyltransferase [Lacibacter sp.]|jgi:methionyl-tRNA formyltransferase
MIGFYLMTEKGFEVLRSVLQAYGPQAVSFVVAAKDPRLQKDYYTEIKMICREHSIPFFNREEKVSLPSCQYRIAISWRWLLSNEEQNLIVVHDSLLPKYRGFNPLVTALIQGDTEIGVTALWAVDEMDAGNIIFQSSCNINYPITIAAAIQKITACYTQVISLIIETVLANKTLPSLPQDAAKVSYSLWRDEEDYHIQWQQPAAQIKRMIDATGYPYAGAFSMVDGEQLRILAAEETEDITIINRDCGKILKLVNGKPVVVCGSGLLLLKEVKDKNGTDYKFTKMRLRFS